jgi:hypothetical protein
LVYAIEVTPKAEAQLKALPKVEAKRILAKLAGLSTDPASGSSGFGVKPAGFGVRPVFGRLRGQTRFRATPGKPSDHEQQSLIPAFAPAPAALPPARAQ